MKHGSATRCSVVPVCLALSLAIASSQAATLHQQSIETSGGLRQYILATPAVADPGRRPLILLLHGHLGSAANALGQGTRPSPLSAWLGIADRQGILVAALQGLKGSDNRSGWHDCRLDDSKNPEADDVGFAAATVGSLVQAGLADPQRIYIMGMSNGGMMAYRLALQMHPAPAAIAAVSSSMAAHSSCTAAPPKVSVLLINGTADPIVPYGGGEVRGGGGTVIGAGASRDFWLHADGLANTPTTVYNFPHGDSSDPTRAQETRYGPRGGLQVETIDIQHGGHVEPSLAYRYGWLYYQLVGTQNKDFESAEEAWNFFKDKTAD